MCDAVKYWIPDYDADEAESAAVIAAGAGYKATLEYLLDDLQLLDESGDRYLVNRWHAAVRPLIDHLDATRPNWRTE
jgi:hypothetical protein